MERQGPRPVPSTAHWRAPVVPWRARRWAPRLSRRAARVVVVAVAPEVGRTSLRAWGRNLRQWPRQTWGAAQAVPAIARRWILRQARRAGRTTSRQAPSAPAKMVRGDRRAPSRKGRGRPGQLRGARWSPAVVVDATAARIRTHRAERAAVRTSAVPIAAVPHLPPFLVTFVAVSMSAAAAESVPATAGDRWLPARVGPSSAKKLRAQTRPRHTTTCPLCVPEWEDEGLGPARSGPQEAKRGRASDPSAGTTPLVSPPRTRARGQHDRSPQSLSRVAGDRLAVPSECHAGRRLSANPRVGAAHASRTCPWRTRVWRHARARSRRRKRQRPPDPRRETGPGPPMRCLARWGAPAQTRPTPQCLFMGRPTMCGLTTGP